MTFPRDLGPHNAYQTEWWYYTGNLATGEGREFGFQLTFFRTALAPPDDELTQPSTDDREGATEPSSWSTNQVYFAHFTISDIENEAS